jgi:NADPH:quinone reductase-like Zn-dependent oxidoreductase
VLDGIVDSSRERSADVVQVVDYTAHQPLHEYLGKEYAERPFDVILDCIGVRGLYEHCPKYLKPGGKYVNVGAGSIPRTLWMHLKTALLPTWLGGVPRPYKPVMAAATGEQQREVIRWFDEGLVKRIPIDSEYSMEDALKVRFSYRNPSAN